MKHCAFASPAERCSGMPQWHHVIKKERLKRRFKHGACWSDIVRQWVPENDLAKQEVSGG